MRSITPRFKYQIVFQSCNKSKCSWCTYHTNNISTLPFQKSPRITEFEHTIHFQAANRNRWIFSFLVLQEEQKQPVIGLYLFKQLFGRSMRLLVWLVSSPHLALCSWVYFCLFCLPCHVPSCRILNWLINSYSLFPSISFVIRHPVLSSWGLPQSRGRVRSTLAPAKARAGSYHNHSPGSARTSAQINTTCPLLAFMLLCGRKVYLFL